MTIIGLMGKARHGKDTVGAIIRSLIPKSETIALADPIKSICREIFDFSDRQLYGDLKEVPDHRYPRDCPECQGTGLSLALLREYGHTEEICEHCNGTGTVYLTPRWAMQYIGTEVARALYSDVWIDYGIRKANGLRNGSLVKTDPDVYVDGVGDMDAQDIVAFTDVRFINEARKITEQGGVIFRIVRPALETQLDGASQAHASEMEQESSEIDQYVSDVILNDTDLDGLELAVKAALEGIGERAGTADLVEREAGSPAELNWKG